MFQFFNIFNITPLFGTIAPPISGYPADIGGLTSFLTNILRLVFLAAGIWAFINFILAGYSFLSASGDPKKIAASWEKIWFTVIGLVIIVGSFILTAIVGFLVFGDPLFILKPRIYGPPNS